MDQELKASLGYVMNTKYAKVVVVVLRLLLLLVVVVLMLELVLVLVVLMLELVLVLVVLMLELVLVLVVLVLELVLVLMKMLMMMMMMTKVTPVKGLSDDPKEVTTDRLRTTALDPVKDTAPKPSGTMLDGVTWHCLLLLRKCKFCLFSFKAAGAQSAICQSLTHHMTLRKVSNHFTLFLLLQNETNNAELLWTRHISLEAHQPCFQSFPIFPPFPGLD
ncbi:hypothetical protein STEG23_015935 [Scotinomys teguina]